MKADGKYKTLQIVTPPRVTGEILISIHQRSRGANEVGGETPAMITVSLTAPKPDDPWNSQNLTFLLKTY